MEDFVAPQAIDVRRCSAAGTKWLDLNADGIRQPGDRELPGFRIYADLDDNGRYTEGEPFAISDAHGDYVIDDILATGTYTLREEPTSGRQGSAAADGDRRPAHLPVPRHQHRRRGTSRGRRRGARPAL